MKRGIYVLAFIAVILAVGVVSAQDIVEGLSSIANAIISILEPVFQALVGETSEPEMLFAKSLLLIIVFSVIWAVLDQIDVTPFDNGYASFFISLAAALLSVRFIGEGDWLQTILLPYTALGVAITCLLPLIIAFYVIEKSIKSRAVRRIAWVFVAVAFIALFFSRYDDMSSGDYVGGVSPAFIYVFAAIGSILLLLFDIPNLETPPLYISLCYLYALESLIFDYT